MLLAVVIDLASNASVDDSLLLIATGSEVQVGHSVAAQFCYSASGVGNAYNIY